MQSSFHLIAISTLALTLLNPSHLQAATYFWNTGSGDWTSSGNWDIAGEPDDVSDTATLGDVSGAYTTTLNANRTIGGFTLSGTEPTLTVNGTLSVSGGTATYSGGTLNGSGIIEWKDGVAVTWSSTTAPGGNLIFQVPVGNTTPMATLDNSGVGSGWGIGAGQELRIVGAYTASATTPRVFQVSDGFTNDGIIALGTNITGGGNTPATDITLEVQSGTLTNSATGTVNMYPRVNDSTGVQDPWSVRIIDGQFDNQGQVNVYTAHGEINGAGAAHTNSGTIDLLNSLTGSLTPGLTISGTSFTNTGTINVNDGTLRVLNATFTNSGSGAVNLTDGELNVIAPTFTLNSAVNLGSGSTVAFGANAVDTVVTWTNDITVPYTFRVNANAEVTVNRTTDWNLLNGQSLELQILGGNGVTGLTVNQDMTNSGTIIMGREPVLPSNDYFINHRMTINSTNSRLTNNADGLLEMYKRNSTQLQTFWSARRLEAELVNAGVFNILTNNGNLGKAAAGIDHVNTGQITFDSKYSIGTLDDTSQLFVTGSSITNAAAGTIGGNGILNVSAIGSGLTNNGTLAPGLSAGILNITGNVTNSSTSQLEIELGGTTLGTVNDLTTEYDQLNVSGTIVLDGDLLVSLINGFGDSVSDLDTFTILTAGNITGTFANLTNDSRVLNADGTGSFLVTINSGSVVLSDFQVPPIPEPSSLLLLAVGALGLVRQTRRRNRNG